MIDFMAELKKFKPVLEVEKLEGETGNDVKDILELLQHLSQKVNEKKE